MAAGQLMKKCYLVQTFVNMMKDFAQAFQDSASTEEFSMFSEEEIIADAQNYGKNVEYVTHELINTSNWQGYQAFYSFDDITKVQISPDPDSKVDIGEEAAENEEEYYFFKFVKGDTPRVNNR